MHEYLERSDPNLMGDYLLIDCYTIKDAEWLYVHLNACRKILAKIPGKNIKITLQQELLYWITIINEVQLNANHPAVKESMVVTIAQQASEALTMNLNGEQASMTQLVKKIAGLVNASASAIQSDMEAMPLSESTINAITKDYFQFRLTGNTSNLLVENTSASVVHHPDTSSRKNEDRTKEQNSSVVASGESLNTGTPVEDSQAKLSPRDILKSHGLPQSILSKIKDVIPPNSAKPPGRMTDTSVAKEMAGIKETINLGLSSLNSTKKFYVLQHMSTCDESGNISDAGQVYVNAFAQIKAFEVWDSKESLKKNRCQKIIDVAATILQEEFPKSQPGQESPESN
jgi:hypothetical protein